MTRVLVARLDNVGDVLLSGPAVRAVAARSSVTYLAGPGGAAAAALLPGVDRVWELRAEWILADSRPIDRRYLSSFVSRVEGEGFDEAIILTSFHQSPLPLALLLRCAGVGRIGAISEDYAGSLLDLRHRVDDDVHEVERALSLVSAFGYDLSPTDRGNLRLRRHDRASGRVGEGSIALHVGASVPARAPGVALLGDVLAQLVELGVSVVLTGAPSERSAADEIFRRAAGRTGRGVRRAVADLVGRTSLAELASVLASCAAVVAGNTGPAHLAAAVGIPVVSIFPPTVPAARWHPWGVPYVLLGDQTIACAGCRARRCPIPGQPCIGPEAVSADDVVSALTALGALRADPREEVAV